MLEFLKDIRFTISGHIFLLPEDDCDKTVEAMLRINYSEEFCLAQDFEEDFLIKLMKAGFLVMSAELEAEDFASEEEGEKKERKYILLPKLHLARSVLFFPDLHIKKSIRHFIPRYELKINKDFDLILDNCVKIHGDAWLTPPLVALLKRLHLRQDPQAKMVSFGVYREGALKAGEIGVICGRVYTSYSGYFEEDNSGTVQIILMAQWLSSEGFDFLDFGMPLDYKEDLGAQNIAPESFVKLFRQARLKP